MPYRERARLTCLIVACCYTFLTLPVTTFLAAFILTAVALKLSQRKDENWEDARVQKIVEKLCKEAKLPVPKLCLQENVKVWASARGITPSRRCIILSSGAAALPDDQLEAILAHELGHYASWDMLDALIWLPALLATIRGGGHGAEYVYYHTQNFAAPLPSSLAAAAAILPITLLLLGVLATNRWSEHRADYYAINLTKNVKGLKDALTHLPEPYLKESFAVFNPHPSPKGRINVLQKILIRKKPSTHA